MENNITNTQEAARYKEIHQRLRTCKLVLDIFDFVLAVPFVIAMIAMTICYQNGDELFTEETAKSFCWLAGIIFVCAVILHTILNNLVESCFEHHYICKKCGHIHTMTPCEDSNLKSGYAYCPECQKITKHKKLSRKEVISQQKTSEAV